MGCDIMSNDLLLNRLPTAPTTSSRRYRTIIIRSIWSMAAVIGLSFLALFGFLYHSTWTFTHPSIEALYSNPMEAHQLPYSDITFSSLDGKSQLSGWYIPSRSKKTVIFSHGYAGNREEIWVPLYDLAKELSTVDYNVLMFDYGYVNRKHNRSRVMTAGVHEAGELLGAVRYAKRLGAEQVYIWGFSMGAGTALQAALDTTEINGMILDSTFLLQPNIIEHIVPAIYPFSQPMIVSMINQILPLTGGSKLSQIPYEEVNAQNYPIPLFMIHGLKDTQAPSTITTRIFEQQTHPNSELWLPPLRGHEMTYRFQSEEYVERTLYFLNSISAQ